MGSRLDKNSSATSKRIASHTFTDESGEEYSASTFGGFTDYMRRKKQKLQNLDAERRSHAAASGEVPQIFRGVVVYINGYTQPSLNDLHELIVTHGGGFLQYLSDGKTTATHIVASNLTPKKRDEFRRYRVVKPAWIVESVKAGRLLAWDAYRVVDDGAKQKVLGFQDGQIVSQTSVGDRRRYREQTDTSWYSGEIKGKAGEIQRQGSSFVATDWAAEGRSSTTAMDMGERSPHKILEADEESSDEPKIEFENDGDDNEEQFDGVDGNGSIGPPVKASKKNLPPEHDEMNLHPDPPSIPASHPDGRPLTAEEHNAILLSNPKVRKSTVVDPGFLKQYYEESRLHHLSTWKAELKSQLQALAQEQSSSQKARAKRPKGARRYVLHVDFDSFFVAVSLLKHPKEFQALPAVVAHGGGSGSEIASCNYPAREFGVKNGMWMKTAQGLCANLKVLPYDFKGYEDASRKFYEAIMKVGGVIQSVSVDEALIDVSSICIDAGGHDGRENSEGSQFREQEKADELGKQIRDEVKAKTGCAVSVGIGGNILQAKLALRKAKPAGQYQMKPEEVLDFVGALSVQNLPGVAYSIGNKLEEIGIKMVKDIREASKAKLISTLGPKTGEKLWEYARGIDRVEVGDQVIRKSVSAEVNWGIRFATQEQAEDFIRAICEELEKRLLNEAVKGRQFSMKIMRRSKDAPLDPPKHLGHGKCDVFNKSVVLGVATNDRSILAREALSILRGFAFSPGELRGIGVQMTKLEPLKGPTLATESSQKLLSFGKVDRSDPKTTPQSNSRPAPSTFAEGVAAETRTTSSSVRRSLFKTFVDEPDLPPSLQKPTATPSRTPVLRGEDEIDSPHKAKATRSAGMMTPIGKITDETSLLNTTGTQFILPSQVDPSVFAELPEDIRSRFRRAHELSQGREAKDADPQAQPTSPTPVGGAFPSQSQLDPEALAALPDDLRAEVLAQYRSNSPGPARQGLLPQSPRKIRTLKAPAKKASAPSKRGGLTSRGRGSRNTASVGFPTLTQANFVAFKDDAEEQEAAEASADFLAALPEDIRAEILEQQRRDRLRKRGGLDVVRKKKVATGNAPVARRTMELPQRVRPTFTSQKLSTLPQLQEAISLWYDDFQDEEPAAEDVDALAKYLQKVILEEQDMAKAVAVVKWVGWVTGNGHEDARRRWSAAFESLKERVQEAVSERGLGRVEF